MDEVQGTLQSLDISNCVVTHLASLLSLWSCLQNLQSLSCIANTLMVIALHRIIRITMCMQADTSFNLLVHLQCLGWRIMNSLPMPTRTRSCSRWMKCKAACSHWTSETVSSHTRPACCHFYPVCKTFSCCCASHVPREPTGFCTTF